MLRSREPLNIGEDLARRRRGAWAAAAFPGATPLSWLGVPIFSGNRALGVLCVQSYDRENAFSDEDLRLLTTIASTVGAGIRNARLYEEARRKADEASALADAGREITESLDPDVVLSRIAMRANALLSRDSAAVFLLEGDGSLRAVVAVGRQAAAAPGLPPPAGRGHRRPGRRHGRGHHRQQTAGRARGRRACPARPTSPDEKLIAAPLAARGQGHRASWPCWRGARRGRLRCPTTCAFLSALARQAAVAIENARLHRRAMDEAQRAAALYESASAARAEAEEANRTQVPLPRQHDPRAAHSPQLDHQPRLPHPGGRARSRPSGHPRGGRADRGRRPPPPRPHQRRPRHGQDRGRPHGRPARGVGLPRR